MNRYTDFKVWTFGAWIKNGHEEYEKYEGTWPQLLKETEFIEFRKKHEITDKQVSLIKKGFHGWPIEDDPEREHRQG